MSARKLIWEVTTGTALVGIGLGAFSLVEQYGLLRGGIMGALLVLAGWLSVEMIYPLWFGK